VHANKRAIILPSLTDVKQKDIIYFSGIFLLDKSANLSNRRNMSQLPCMGRWGIVANPPTCLVLHLPMHFLTREQ